MNQLETFQRASKMKILEIPGPELVFFDRPGNTYSCHLTASFTNNEEVEMGTRHEHERGSTFSPTDD